MASEAPATNNDTETASEPDTTDTETSDDAASPAEVPTCETLIGQAVVDDFLSVGWSVKTETFYLGNIEIAEGIQCIWADYESQANDQPQIFGWAPIDSDGAADAQRALVAEGWVQEDAAEGVYITENPDTAFARDENGYGVTYLFIDGEVLQADTKQGLLLIDWPAS
ncbi:hypothetical protein [Microbacterium sp. C7(2022)]|uniref:hypothetical protein n=1 Tax=Microbacterium sp. C7(2022) TaxID=2992759 RepID=UPI00237A1960|nr:hypothetical protein [Microbacterium sp. C7(2022)]MDE0545640.1 hypothetical protein [Microbacterium sp. C7(2022)]